MARFVMPGSSALRSIVSLKASNPLALSCLRSSISSPCAQCFATVCLCSPYFLPISVKLGFIPSWRYMLSSPITFLSNRPPPKRGTLGSQLNAGSQNGESTVARVAHLR